MTAGTVIAAVRARLVTQLAARPGMSDTTVIYNEPEQAAQLDAGETCWLASAATGDVTQAALKPLPLKTEEEWQQDVVFQVLGRDDSYTQDVAEVRVADLVGELLELLATGPDLGLTVSGWDRVLVLPSSWAWEAGPFLVGGGTNYGARCVVTLNVIAVRS